MHDPICPGYKTPCQYEVQMTVFTKKPVVLHTIEYAPQKVVRVCEFCAYEMTQIDHVAVVMPSR